MNINGLEHQQMLERERLVVDALNKNLTAKCDHDLQVVDDSYDHEYGVEQIFYHQCIKCDATQEEDSSIPDVD